VVSARLFLACLSLAHLLSGCACTTRIHVEHSSFGAISPKKIVEKTGGRKPRRYWTSARYSVLGENGFRKLNAAMSIFTHSSSPALCWQCVSIAFRQVLFMAVFSGGGLARPTRWHHQKARRGALRVGGWWRSGRQLHAGRRDRRGILRCSQLAGKRE